MNIYTQLLRASRPVLFSAIALVSHVFIAPDASAQQVNYSPIEIKDKNGEYTDCGFQFVATLPEGYGLQGSAMYNQYTHLDFDITAGKLVRGALEALQPKDVTLLVRGNYLQDKRATPIAIYADGKRIKKLAVPRKRVTYSLIDDMLSRGFTVSYIASNNTKIELDFPPDFATYGKFTSNCRAKMIYRAQQNYLKGNKDATCWENPDQCRGKSSKKSEPAP